MTSFLAGLFVAAQLVCPETLILNFSNMQINDKDLEVLEMVKQRCKKDYGPNSCVVQFTKHKNGQAHAQCGLAEEK